MLKKNIKIILLMMFIGNFINCTNDKYDIDISNIKQEPEYYRMDKMLYDTSADSVIANIPKIMSKHSDFFRTLTMRVIPMGDVDNRIFPYKMRTYLTNSTTKEVVEEWRRKFNNIDDIKEKISTGFKRFLYYYPDTKLPKIYTCLSAFNYSVFTGEDFIGIGLDMYFGADYKMYNNINGWHTYMSSWTTPERIPIDCIDAWTDLKFPYNDSIDNVVCNMIYKGRKKYFIKAIFPEATDSLIMGYSEKKIEWCKLSEKNMWDYLVDKKLLFSTENLDIKKLTFAGPFTHFFSRKSPGEVGNWIGWQIVKAYMEKNPTMSLQELMAKTDYMEILNNAYYNP